MIKNGILYRKAKRNDIPKLVSLINSNYNRKKNEDYFKWQFFTQRLPSLIICAFKGKRLIGMFGLQKRFLLSSSLICAQAIDLLVSEDFRGKGIFTNMGSFAETEFKGLDFIFTLANTKGKSACQKGLSYKTINIVRTYELNKNISFRKNYAQIEKIGQNTKFKNFKHKLPKDTLRFKYEHFYRKWRYALNPIYSYYIAKIKTGEFAIFKVFRDPITCRLSGDIVDFECLREEKDKLNSIILSSCHYLQEKLGIRRLTIWAIPKTAIHDVVKDIGFNESNEKRYFCIKALTNNFSKNYFWDLVQADSEVY